MNFITNKKIFALFSVIILLSVVFLNIFPKSSGLDPAIIGDEPLNNDPVPPEFGVNGTGASATTGDLFTFSINVTDNISDVSVNYTWVGAGSQWVNKSMINPVSNMWINISTMPTFVTVINYYFWAIDFSNNTNITGPGFITVSDNDPPTYNSSSENFSANIGEGFTIYANFTDNLGEINVDSAIIYYKKETVGIFDSELMTKTAPGEFEITNTTMGIDTSMDDTDYYYQLWVNDTMDNNETYPIGYNFLISVIDNIAPTAANGSGDISVFCSTQFTIYANFTDNLNVTSAKIFFRTESDPIYKNTTMIEHSALDGSFSVINSTMGLNIYNNTQNISYYVIGYDKDKNEAHYNDSGGEDWNITVIDDIKPTPIEGSGSFYGSTSYPFDVWVNFTDNINVSGAVIYFKYKSDATYFQCNMTPTNSKGEFSASTDDLSENSDIDTTYSLESIVYYILGFDPSNNPGNYTNLGVDWEIKINDTTPPDIIDGSSDFTVTTGEPFTIYANFSDNINISHAEIYYKRKGSEDPWDYKAMDEPVGKKGNFYITKQELGVNTYNDNTAIQYYVIAHDLNGNIKNYTKTGGRWKITVIDNDPPEFQSGSENISIGTGDTFNVYANFSDNIKVESIRFFYKSESWNHWEYDIFSTEDENDDNVWEFNISSSELHSMVETYNDDSDYFFHIKANDGSTPYPNIINYTYGTNGFRIMVRDDDPPESTKPKGSGDLRATTGEPFTIFANFTDNIEVDFARIYIRKQLGDANYPAGVNMTESNSDSGKFSIINQDLNINTSLNDTDYEYYIACYDTVGNQYIYDTNDEPFEIEVIDNDEPIAIAGTNHRIEEGTTVEFNGNLSSDNIGIVAYQWTFTYDNLERYLDGVKTSFEFITIKNYEIKLTVTDAKGNEGTDTLWVNVTNKNYPPEIESFKPGDDEEVYAFQDVNIFVRFNEDMEIDENNVGFFFMNDSANNPVEGSFDWFTDEVMEIYQLTFVPDTQLEYDMTYTITVTAAVFEKFEAGLHLKSGKTWTFSTYPEDSDGDKLPDWWEVKYFNYINEVGPDADDDNDGFTNLEEYLGPDGEPGGDDSTNPNDPNDYPAKKEKDTKTPFNIMIAVIAVIFIILILIIIVVAIMAMKKKKADEEESKKPKPIEHEILFEDGRGLPGKNLYIPPEADAGTEQEKTSDKSEIQIEDVLETEKTTTRIEPETEIKEPEMDDFHVDDLSEEGEIPALDKESLDDMELKDLDIESEPLEEAEMPAEFELSEEQQKLIQEYTENGTKYYEEKKYSEAVIEWQKALDIDPDQPEILNSLKNTMEKIKK